MEGVKGTEGRRDFGPARDVGYGGTAGGAVRAASVIVESVVAFEVACALVDKFGGDSLPEMKARYELFLKMARER